MNLDRRFRLVLILNVAVSMLGFGIANDVLFVVPPVLALSLTGWWVTEYRAQRRGWRGLPRWLSNSILLVMLMVAVLRAFATTDLVMSFTEFLIAILIIKLWERRKVRDYGQLLTLSLFMSVGSTLGSASVLMGLVWAIHLPLLIAGVMMFQVFAGRARAGVSTLDISGGGGGGGGGGAGVPSSGLVMRRAPFFRLWACVLLIGMAVSGAIFLIVPRGMGSEEFGFQFKRQEVSGFTEEVDPGEGSLISNSYSTVMEVQYSDRLGRPLGGSGQAFYMRGAVLNEYGQGGTTTWQARRVGGVDYPASHGRAFRLGDAAAYEVEQRVTVLAGSGDEAPLFSLFQPVEVRLDPTLQKQWVRYERGTGRISRHPAHARVNYTVRSAVPPPDPSVVVRHDAPEYPSVRVKQYAWDVLRRANIEPDPAIRPLEDDERAAAAFETHLRSEFQYGTDQLKADVGVDPTEWFLYKAKRGHCEYFASAMAAMCRSVGINARVVAGYLATEYDPNRGVYVVRESDAHAWAEVDTGPGGWKVMDATPMSTGQVVRIAGLLGSLAKAYASVADYWNIHVATFGPQDQERLLGHLGMSNLTERSAEWYRDMVRVLRRVRRAVQSPTTLATAVGLIILAAGLMWAGVRAWKRRTVRREHFGWAMNGPERRVYRELLRVLAGRGYEKPAWIPPLVHVRTIAQRDPRLARQAGSIFEHVYAARFGHEPARLTVALAELSTLQENA